MAAANNTKAKQILKDILKCEVKLEDAKENIQVLKTALDTLIAHMKTINPVFSQLFNRIFYTGSYFDGLRVKSATEFDLNVVLVLPVKSTDYEISTNCSPASFSKFHLKSTMEVLATRPQWQSIRTVLERFFDSDNYLIPDKIRLWFLGVVDSAVKSLPDVAKVTKIRRAVSGPAITLYITTTSGVQLDVDLVPVIEFKWPNWPNNAKQHYTKLNVPEEKRFWFIVPKPAPTSLAGAREKVERLWRLHFPEVERHILYTKGCAKSVIKLMKLLRDKQDWKVLASYYLKTVVMWSIINDKLDWNELYIDTLFPEMLKKLAEYVKKRNLPYLFYPSFNLLYKLTENSVHADNLHGSIIRIVRNIEQNPETYNTLMRK